jgi:hypothetical protein
MALWQRYNEAALAQAPEDRTIVTHYRSFMHAPAEELRRVLDFLGVHADDERIEEASKLAETDLMHAFDTGEALPEDVGNLYEALCKKAGPIFERQASDPEFQGQLRAGALNRALHKVHVLEDLHAMRLEEVYRLRRSVDYLTARMSPADRLSYRVTEKMRRVRERFMR